MAFCLEATKKVLGKTSTIYYVSTHKWTMNIEDRTVFDTEHQANASKSGEIIQGTVVSI